jgi:hypothetical protein
MGTIEGFLPKLTTAGELTAVTMQHYLKAKSIFRSSPHGIG